MLKLLPRPSEPVPVPQPQIEGLEYARCSIPDCINKENELPDPDVRFVTLAKDMDTDLEYVNVQHHHIGAQYKVMKAISGTPTGDVNITFWADNLKEWLTCDVPPDYRFTTSPEYLARAARPTIQSPEVRRRRAAHLSQYRRERHELTPEPAQPDKCIFGQIGANKVLVDPGDGTILGTYEIVGFNAANEAAVLNRQLVKQSEATLYAMTKLRRAWADAKAIK